MKDSVISQRMVDAFVYLAITDTSFLKTVKGVVQPKHFKNSVVRDIIKLCYNFYDITGSAPKDHLHDELVATLSGKKSEEKEFVLHYLTKIQEVEKPNKEYVLSRINKYVQAIEFEDAAVKFIEIASKGNFEQAKELMQRALRMGVSTEDIGIKYFEESHPTYLSDKKSSAYLMPTGFSALDERLIRGICRTDFVLIMGGFKGKKSWSCINLGEAALFYGLKVLHISHELSAEDTEMRYDMSINQLTSDFQNGDDRSIVTFEEYDDEGSPIDRWEVPVESVYNTSLVMKGRKNIATFGGNLIIKKYPMGRCTMGEINRYLDYLETYEGFMPDLVINDYIEKMLVPENAARHDAINGMYLESKGIADERKLAMVTVSQVNRAGLEKAIMDQGDTAEDIRKIGNVDLMLAISQSKMQRNSNIMQAYVVANRHGDDKFGCAFNSNLKVGQLIIDCWPLRQASWGE
jgi:hypothetical protein